MAFNSSLIKIFSVIAFLIIIKCQEEEQNQTGEAPEPSHTDKSVTSLFYSEWDQKMRDYAGDYVYMIPINYKSSEVFFDTITTVPARIRGAFLIDEEKKDMIDFEIKDPNGYPVYANSTSHAIFDFNVAQAGRYSIVFNNRYVNGEVRVTFTLCLGQNPILKKEDLTHSEQKLDNLLDFIKRIMTENRLSRNMHSARYQSKNRHM